MAFHSHRLADQTNSMQDSNPQLSLGQLLTFCRRDQELCNSLMECQSYQHFFQILFFTKKSLYPKFSFALFASRAGFASKSFAKDVMAYKKRLTTRSFFQVVKGLRLDAELTEHLRLLIAHQEEDFITGYSKELVAKLLHKRRHAMRVALTKKYSEASIFDHAHAPRVYAALQDVDAGNSLAGITEKTGFTVRSVRSALRHLKSIGLVERVARDDCYRPSVYDVYLQNKNSKSSFQTYYAKFLRELGTKVLKADFSDPKNLFWLSHASVNSSDLPKLKEELRVILKRYTERMEDSGGDAIVNLCVQLS